MTIENPAIDSIFLAALEKGTPQERATFLDGVCGQKSAIRRRVDKLLAAHAKAATFLEQPAVAGRPAQHGRTSERPGDTIGRYKLLEQIGEGGFGVVYLAEQTQPVRRQVALKVVKAGMDTREVIARFEAERQALAMMDHPNIAKVHDAGATDSGRPYFVMELVKGIPITEYCDQCNLTTNERLELFLSVCQGVQHAHQRGIIHRDIKPTNVLVAMLDGRPAAKIIDFGVAKAINQQLTENTLQTGFAQIMGTPLYMSPEQAEMSPLEVDTRSDVYSLGVLLYELITGTTPLERERLSKAGFDELRQIIRHEEPPRPSARLSTLSAHLATTIAEHRRANPRKLCQLVRGGPDWIVTKALEKDRNRRYESASELAADVHRYLNGEPIKAHPPTTVYRVHRFVSRNKAMLVVAACLVTAIALAGGTTGWFLHTESARRDRLEQRVDLAMSDVMRLEEQGKWPEALALAQQARTLVANGDGGTALRRQIDERVSQLELVARLQEIRLQLGDEPSESGPDFSGTDAAYAATFQEYGLDLDKLAVNDAAQRIHELEVRVQVAVALDDWSHARRNVNPEDDAAWKHLLEVARGADPDPWREKLRTALLRDDQESIEKLAGTTRISELPVTSAALLGRTLIRAKHVQEAAVLLRQIQRQHPSDFWANILLAVALQRSSPPQLDESIGFMRAAVALRPNSAAAHDELGRTLRRRGWHDRAIDAHRQAIDLDPDVALLRCSLVDTLRESGRFDEALQECRTAIELFPDDAATHSALGNVYFDKGQFDAAIVEYREAIRLDPESSGPHNNLGAALGKRKEWDASIACLREAIRLKPDNAAAHHNLARSFWGKGLHEKAITSFRRAVELKPDDLNAQVDLGAALAENDQLDKAITQFRHALRLRPDHFRPHNQLGLALRRKGLTDDAIAEFRAVIRLNPSEVAGYYNLGQAFKDKGQFDEAIVAFQRAVAITPDDARFHETLGDMLLATAQRDEAMAHFRKALLLQPDSAHAHNNLGNALRDGGLLNQAIAEYREAIRCDPDEPKLHFNLASALQEQGNLDEAIRCCREAIRIKPDYYSARNILGSLWADKGQLDEAVAEFKRAVGLRPNYAKAQSNLGVVLANQGHLDEAIAAHKEAIRLEPNSPLAHNNFGSALEKKGARDEAIVEYRQAVRLQPAKVLFHDNLADALYRDGQFDEAITAFRETIRLKPDFADGWMNLGLALEKKGEVAEALKAWREAVRLQPGRAELFAKLTLALATSADPDLRDGPLAVTYGKKAVDLAPTADNWSNLGVAHYAAGDWQAAADALERAHRLNKQINNCRRFYLVMAYWQLGKHEEALRCYYETVKWIDATKQDDKGLVRLRTQAERLLGISRRQPSDVSSDVGDGNANDQVKVFDP